MNDELIRRYNSKIKNEDTVIWLGDCFFGKDPTVYSETLRRFNGEKILIVGNHDSAMGEMAGVGFSLALKEAVISTEGIPCRLNHYPYWEGLPKDKKLDRFSHLRPIYSKGEVLLHGHTHSRERVRRNMINVGVDAWDYGPVLIQEVTSLIKVISYGN
jgi:calcineurin-like phosphoesterase family protein